MNADSNNPVLPFVVWIAAVDLLCLEAWQVNAYAVGPQPWELWHADGWTPERAVMELSTPTTSPDLEDLVWLLNQPTVTTNSTFRRIMDNKNLFIREPPGREPPSGEVIEIALRYLDIQDALIYPPASREDKIRALARLGITVEPDQHPLTAWMLAMCRENNLPEQRPSIPNECAPPRAGALSISEAAQELCSKWVWWLA